MTDFFKTALKEIELLRSNAQKKIEQRRQKIYEEFPRLYEIEKELSDIGLKTIKLVIGRYSEDELTKLKDKSLKLSSEKKHILQENGYNLNYEDAYNCKTCQDLGFLNGLQCNCLKQRVIEKYYEMSNLSRILDKENFDSFNINYYSTEADPKTGVSPRDNMEMIYTRSVNFVNNFDDTYTNLLFQGRTGLGKTFLSNCIARELLQKGKTVIYATSPQVFRLAENGRFNREENHNQQPFLDMILSVDLLIMDDLGTELTSRVTSADLFNIINTRLLNKKSTIISTNLSLKELEKYYTDRIVSRIMGEYTLFNFKGEDIRVMKKYI